MGDCFTKEFRRELASLLNKHGIDNELSTSDWNLAEYTIRSLQTYGFALYSEASRLKRDPHCPETRVDALPRYRCSGCEKEWDEGDQPDNYCPTCLNPQHESGKIRGYQVNVPCEVDENFGRTLDQAMVTKPAES
jgi:hypothetical protein